MTFDTQLSISSKNPSIIAGPCSAENEQQVVETALQLAKMGITVFRAGVWKPRTKPGSFEGVGEPALKWLQRVKKETGMKIAVEVANRRHIEASLQHDIDILWIGARTTANPFAVQEIADTLKGNEKTVVLVKNPVSPDLDLWIGAIERIYNAGVRKIGAIHRGFYMYGENLYRNVPLWYIPIELKRRYQKLPILCDPSHISGNRTLLAGVAQQAMDLNFDGLIIESHYYPDIALSDKEQQITPSQLQQLLNNLQIRTVKRDTQALALMRQEIDEIDHMLLDLLSKRMHVSREIGDYKKAHNMPILQTKRYDFIMNDRVSHAGQLKLSPDFIAKTFEAIHEESVKQQMKVLIQKKCANKK